MVLYIIYEIVCNDPEIKDIYIGQTKNYRVRKNAHKTCCKNTFRKDKSQRKVYEFINNHGGWNNWTMRPIETIEYERHIDALIRVQYWIKEKNATLNCN